ncbi:MAG: hypothetical protein WAW15_02445 [Minisyncoccales bacterium]
MTKRFDELCEEYQNFRKEIFEQSIFLPLKIGPNTFKDATISFEQREILNEIRILLPKEVKLIRRIDKLYHLYDLSFKFQDDKLCDEIFNKMVGVIKNSKNITSEKIKKLKGISISMQMNFYRYGLPCYPKTK